MRFRLKAVFEAIAICACVSMIAAVYLRALAARPDLHYSVRIDFSQAYDPMLGTETVNLFANELEGVSSEDLEKLEKKLHGGMLRVLPDSRAGCSVWVMGKSWQEGPEEIARLANVAVAVIEGRAANDGINCTIFSVQFGAADYLIPNEVLATVEQQ